MPANLGTFTSLREAVRAIIAESETIPAVIPPMPRDPITVTIDTESLRIMPNANTAAAPASPANLGPAEINALEQEEILSHVKELIANNYSAIVDNRDEQGNLHASIRISVGRGADPCMVKVSISIPVPAIKDEIETAFDPLQGELFAPEASSVVSRARPQP